MTTLNAPEAAVVEGLDALPDFTTEAYKDAYSRINAIVIEGEQEAHDNYISLGTLIPDQKDELAKLARMEMKHMKGFTSCVAATWVLKLTWHLPRSSLSPCMATSRRL